MDISNLKKEKEKKKRYHDLLNYTMVIYKSRTWGKKLSSLKCVYDFSTTSRLNQLPYSHELIFFGIYSNCFLSIHFSLIPLFLLQFTKDILLINEN